MQAITQMEDIVKLFGEMKIQIEALKLETEFKTEEIARLKKLLHNKDNQTQIEKIIDSSHGYLFGCSKKCGFSFSVSHRFDAAVPFNCIHSENRLFQSQCHRNRHISF